MANERYEIHIVKYDNNWKETTEVAYKGAILQQMKDLIRGLKSRQGDKVLSIYIFDTQTGEKHDEHRLSY